STGFCDCFSDCKNCCITCWCPCITFGQVAEIVDQYNIEAQSCPAASLYGTGPRSRSLIVIPICIMYIY
ncbi:unnamed protein product, partial [Brassica oleracea var. botrytis]